MADNTINVNLDLDDYKEMVWSREVKIAGMQKGLNQLLQRLNIAEQEIDNLQNDLADARAENAKLKDENETLLKTANVLADDGLDTMNRFSRHLNGVKTKVQEDAPAG